MSDAPVFDSLSSVGLVTVGKTEGIAIVTLNRPEAMNALSAALRLELAAAMIALDDDDDVRVIILTGAGNRAFTAGLDLKEPLTASEGLSAASERNPKNNPVLAMELCRKPIIGAINGVAITGGFEVALACDILIGSTNARFADTHARIGIMPGWGLSQKLSRIIGIGRAKELSLSGNFLDAATAEHWGLLNRVVAPEALLASAMQLARDIASPDPVMVQSYKQLIDSGYAKSLTDGLVEEQDNSVATYNTIKPEDVEARCAAVMARGRSQQEPGKSAL